MVAVPFITALDRGEWAEMRRSGRWRIFADILFSLSAHRDSWDMLGFSGWSLHGPGDEDSTSKVFQNGTERLCRITIMLLVLKCILDAYQELGHIYYFISSMYYCSSSRPAIINLLVCEVSRSIVAIRQRWPVGSGSSVTPHLHFSLLMSSYLNDFDLNSSLCHTLISHSGPQKHTV